MSMRYVSLSWVESAHTFVNDQTLRGPLLFFPLSLYLTHPHRLCTRMTSEDRWEQRTASRGPIVPIEKCPQRVWPSLYTETSLNKHSYLTCCWANDGDVAVRLHNTLVGFCSHPVGFSQLILDGPNLSTDRLCLLPANHMNMRSINWTESKVYSG